MNGRPLFPFLLYVWIGCCIASGITSLLFDVKVPFLAILVLLVCFGSLFAFAFQLCWAGVKAVVAPESDQPELAEEQQQFQPLVNIANSRNGTYENLGRAGKSVIESDFGKYSLTAKVGAIKFQLVVAAQMPQEGLILEVSRDPIRRKGLMNSIYGDNDTDGELSFGSNIHGFSENVIAQCGQKLLSLGNDFSLTTVRGNLELRRQLPFLNDENVLESLNAFESVHHAIADLSKADRRAAS